MSPRWWSLGRSKPGESLESRDPGLRRDDEGASVIAAKAGISAATLGADPAVICQAAAMLLDGAVATLPASSSGEFTSTGVRSRTLTAATGATARTTRPRFEARATGWRTALRGATATLALTLAGALALTATLAVAFARGAASATCADSPRPVAITEARTTANQFFFNFMCVTTTALSLQSKCNKISQ